ncbi:MAG TPA: glutamyl-tRNA reductase [Chitinophagales bacterium]|nr:glutamyl-tRNA reductase [Chitinophagales bacterium]
MSNYERLVVAGVNFRKTSLEVRSKFALTTDSIRKIYEENNPEHPGDFFILSTCNRTEIYSTIQQPEKLIHLLAAHKDLSPDELINYTFTKTDNEAVKHLFRVASGLDSQILGDYEIVGQLKNAFNLAKGYGKTSGYVEKLINGAVQASKQVKNNTALSDGTTSVSYAVIQLLKNNIESSSPLHVCLMGLGKIGTLTLKNLRCYLPQHQITLVNRNEEKAELTAGEYKVSYAPFASQQEVMSSADILIVATGADHPIITKSDVEQSRVKLVFDLSVPSNVSPEVKNLEGIQMYDIDELSKIVNDTIESRRTEIPIAESIIDEHIDEFRQWEERRNIFATAASGMHSMAASKDA